MRALPVPLFFLSAGSTALASAGDTSEWLALVSLGGPVVAVLLLMSSVALAVGAYKWLQLRAWKDSALARIRSAVDLWMTGDAEGAARALEEVKLPFAQIVGQAMQWLGAGVVDRSAVETELSRLVQHEYDRLNRRLGVLEQVSYLAPLLGLLGTVLGIINVFQGLADQGSAADAGLLAGGIWEALITTAVGLCVAIPFALLHAALQGRVVLIGGAMQDQLTRLMGADLYKQS